MFSHQYHKTELTCLKKPMREGNENFKFAYAGMHGNLKLILNKPLHTEYVKLFSSEEDIVNIISI